MTQTRFSNAITELELERDRIEKIIADIRALEGSGKSTALPRSLPVAASSDLAAMSAYQAAVKLLEDRKIPLTTREIVDAIIASGKKQARPVISSSLFKAVAQKKICELVRNKKTGKWMLKGWKV